MTTPWRAALARTVLVPTELRTATLELAIAAERLDCDTDELHALVDAGFPAERRSDDVLFDPLDVINLALTAGTGTSHAELSERQALKLATGEPSRWVATKHSRIELSALRGDAEHHAPPYQPDVESYGGQLHTWREVGPATVQAEVSTVGSPYEVTDPVARKVFGEVFDGLRSGRYRFAWLPAALRTKPDIAIEQGLMDCEIASILVARACAAGGLTTRTRVGFLLGLVGVEHCWTEVWLDDGWRSLDPLLAYLATRHPKTRPEFTEFCLGSTPARRLAWPCPAGTPIAPSDGVGDPVSVRCRLLPAVVDRGE